MSEGKISTIEILSKEKEKNLYMKMDRLISSHLKEFEKMDKIYLTDATINDLKKYTQEYTRFSEKWMEYIENKMDDLIKNDNSTGAENILQQAIIQNKNYLDADKYFLYRHANQEKESLEAMAYFLIKVGGDELLPLLK